MPDTTAPTCRLDPGVELVQPRGVIPRCYFTAKGHGLDLWVESDRGIARCVVRLVGLKRRDGLPLLRREAVGVHRPTLRGGLTHHDPKTQRDDQLVALPKRHR